MDTEVTNSDCSSKTRGPTKFLVRPVLGGGIYHLGDDCAKAPLKGNCEHNNLIIKQEDYKDAQ
jgi:hypothetical protein